MAGASRTASDPIIIKKYANRRLYNTAKSSYVTLEDLSKMVRAAEDFQVFDAKTGEDITRSVLTQIIFEEESKGSSMLPASFLRQIIRLYGDALQSVVPGYLEASMDAFSRNQERIRESFGTNTVMSTFETMARSNMEWFEQAMKMFGTFGQTPGMPRPGGAPRPAEPRAASKGPDLGQDLEALQRQLREMQDQLARLSAGKPGTGTDGG